MLNKLKLEYHIFMTGYHVNMYEKLSEHCKSNNIAGEDAGNLEKEFQKVIDHTQSVVNLSENGSKIHMDSVKSLDGLNETKKNYDLEKKMAENVLDSLGIK